MTWLSAPVSDFRSKRKCFSISGSLCLVLLLLVSQTACRSQHDDVEAVDGLAVSDEYGDVDNVEFHRVKIVDGVMHEDHPVIMYKEDFVSEDYDPSKKQRNKSAKSDSASSESLHSTSASVHLPRKYKDIAHRRRRIDHIEKEQYRALKPEKIYFDVLSPARVVVSDESTGNDSKFDTSKIRVDVISLADDEAVNEKAKNDGVNEENAEPNKQVLNKRPKKYYKRIRRDISADTAAAAGGAQDQRRKRNIYWRPVASANSVAPVPSNQYLPPISSQANYYRYSVPGNFYNGIDKVVVDSRFGGENEKDRVVWRDLTVFRDPNRRLNATSRPSRPVFREPQENTPLFTRRPVTPSASAGSSGSFAGQTTTSRPIEESETAPTDSELPPVSTCVWAISQCCSGFDNKIRYRCFERYGCNGVFWGQNPCADRIRDNVADFLATIYNK